MEKKPNFKKIEKKWQKKWVKNKTYKFDSKSNKPIFSIDTPPPYASAKHLHVGHALHYTQFEIVARFWRMNGYNVYFPPCFDNNGLPTEKYVEEKYNISKATTTKTEFIKLCREASKEAEKNYSDRFFKALGHSYDWDLLYTTIDPEAQKVSQTAFLDLVNKDLVYRAKEPVLWCPYHQTALAQAEVESKKRNTRLVYLYFELENGDKIKIATTRLELLPACVGVFVHPKDKRYKNLIGKKVKVPLFEQKVPVMADEEVDKEFGSGIVMISTFGDSTDVEWWKKHNLPLRICITEDGKLNELAGKYKGLDFERAKRAIKDDLAGKGYLIKEEPLQQEVGVCWRCKNPVEYLVTKQWFIKILDHKKELVKQGKKLNWHPSFMRNRYEDWVKNLSWDWCISRQRFYGVPIPVWYCKKCGEPVFPDRKDLPVNPEDCKPNKKCKCGSSEFKPEHDVFDTWMTSSMTPQIACRWLEDNKLHDKLFPMSLRPQAADIIRSWLFYTVTKSKYLFDSIPWKDVMIGTYVLDEKGKGMHKSTGNVVWLTDLLENYSADAVRYWVGTASVGEDLPFKEKEMVRGQKILTKLWNASRFVSMHLDKKPKKENLEIADKWILSRLSEVTKNYKKYFKNYEISKARKEIEMYFLHEFCDFYLEMIKHRLYGDDKKSKKAARYTLHKCLLAILKMWAPFIPHITEELYQTIFDKKGSIHTSEFEEAPKKSKKALKLGKLAQDIITEIRKYKQENNMSMGAELEEYKLKTKEDVEPIKDLIKGTMRIKKLKTK